MGSPVGQLVLQGRSVRRGKRIRRSFRNTAIKFFENVDKLLQVDPAVAATELFDEQGTLVAEMGGNILPMASIDQCVLVNEDIGNVPTGGIGIGWNYSIEQMFYNNPDQH